MSKFAITLILDPIIMVKGKKKLRSDEVTAWAYTREPSILEPDHAEVFRYFNYIDAVLSDYPVILLFADYRPSNNSLYFEIKSQDPNTSVAELHLIFTHPGIHLRRWVDAGAPYVTTGTIGYMSFILNNISRLADAEG